MVIYARITEFENEKLAQKPCGTYNSFTLQREFKLSELQRLGEVQGWTENLDLLIPKPGLLLLHTTLNIYLS